MEELLTKHAICNLMGIKPRLFEEFRALDIIPGPKEIKRTGKRGAIGLYDSNVVDGIREIQDLHQIGFPYPLLKKIPFHRKDLLSVKEKVTTKEVTPHKDYSFVEFCERIMSGLPKGEAVVMVYEVKERKGKSRGVNTRAIPYPQKRHKRG